VDLPRFIIGVDEAGYGCIAGPLVAAAVAFREGQARPTVTTPKGRLVPVKDSKKLPDELLVPMAQTVAGDCCGYEIQRISAPTIDGQGPEQAKFQALQMVVRRLLERLRFLHSDTVAYRVIVDGHVRFGECNFEYDAIPRADVTVWQVSAASVLAKSAQLEAIQRLHLEFPQYGWNRNHGYPTETHLTALRRFGVTPYHRRSYGPVSAILSCRRKIVGGGWEWD
jgi:ribonuclease HII